MPAEKLISMRKNLVMSLHSGVFANLATAFAQRKPYNGVGLPLDPKRSKHPIRKSLTPILWIRHQSPALFNRSAPHLIYDKGEG